jgi:hypothetical protein
VFRRCHFALPEAELIETLRGSRNWAEPAELTEVGPPG